MTMPMGKMSQKIGGNVGARRAVPLLIACALAFILVACSPASNEKGKGQVTLHLFTWSDYTEETAVKQFEERFGIKVASDTFGSNEELLAKLQGGASGYDVVVPSDYMVSILIKQGLLAEIDPAKIPNRSEEHTSELQSLAYLVCRLLLEKKKKKQNTY